MSYFLSVDELLMQAEHVRSMRDALLAFNSEFNVQPEEVSKTIKRKDAK